MAKLPHLFRRIIEQQHEIETHCSQSIVDFGHFKELKATRRTLVREADRLYRPLTTVGGPAHA